MRRIALLLALLVVLPATASSEDRYGRFETTEQPDGTLDVVGRNLQFTADPRGPELRGLDCRGEAMVDAVRPPGPGTVEAESLNRAAFVDASGSRMVVLQDDARCSLQVFSTDAGRPIVVFPESLECSGAAPVRCVDGDRVVLMHVAGEALANQGGYVVSGHATIVSMQPSGLGEAYDDALQDGRIAAEVTLGAVQGFVVSQTVTIGDMDVSVSGTPGNLTARISSDNPEGRAITLELDPSQYTRPNITIVEIEDGQRIPAMVIEVASVEELFATPPEAGIPVWRSGATIVVYFHHYSEKELNLQESVNEGVKLGIRDAIEDAPVPVWVGLVALAAVLVIRRRHR